MAFFPTPPQYGRMCKGLQNGICSRFRNYIFPYVDVSFLPQEYKECSGTCHTARMISCAGPLGPHFLIISCILLKVAEVGGLPGIRIELGSNNIFS